MQSYSLREAASARAGFLRGRSDRPNQRRAGVRADTPASLPLPLRVLRSSAEDPAAPVSDVTEAVSATVGGMASVTEQPYEMYDFYGPYTEVVDLEAFDSTLASSPLVEFTVNHGAGGAMPMAHTRNGTLVLSAVKDGPETGLAYEATVDPARSDVANLLLALERGDVAEASFKFTIEAGLWSPDYTEYRIKRVNLDRGDVSAVNFGANPLASSGIRSDGAVSGSLTLTIPSTTWTGPAKMPARALPVQISDEDITPRRARSL